MHAMGMHSALAIKRQRKRRDEQKRARERRYSTQSTESGLTSPHNSMGSLADHHARRKRGGKGHGKAPGDGVGSKVVTSVGMLHIGVVFLVLGAFLLVSGLLPEDINTWGSSITAGSWFNELVITGAIAFSLGVFLIILNRIISKREEDDLNEYVQRQLTRSRSGHRLIRDVETGCLTTKQQARSRQGAGLGAGLGAVAGEDGDSVVSGLDLPAPVHGSPGPKSPSHFGQHIAFEGELPLSPLEPVLEEEPSEKGEEEARAMDYLSKEALSNGSTTGGSLSPGSPSETAVLLGGGARHHLHHAGAALRI